MTSTLTQEIEAAVRALRQHHELEVHQTERLEQFMEAHASDIQDRIRGIRERESYRRADLARELLTLASEIGLLPAPSPKPIALDEPPPMRMPNCIARTASDDLSQSIN